MKPLLFLCTAAFAVALFEFNCILASADVQLKLLRCSQSSNYFVYRCDRAIDGNLNQDFAIGLSCSHTGSESSGWWSAQVEKTALMKEVRIYNRKDCCAERLTNFTISVDGSVCTTYTGAAFSEKTFSCGKKGFVLRIASRKQYMALCEVVVTGQYVDEKLNLTKCQQSSTYGVNVCARAIDGNLNQDLSGGSCSHVGSESVGWWKAETTKRARFNYVHIFNRQDCCGDRLTKFEISVNDRVCHAYNGVAFSDKFLSCFKYGSVLKINSSKPYLTLCEVVVIGRYLDRAIRLSKCNQSSTYLNQVCGRAIDGNRDQRSNGISCSRLYFDNTGWWQAETDKPAVMGFVKIYNSMESCCNKTLINFKIYVNNELCREYKGDPFSVQTFPLCFKAGTVLKIASDEPLMTLCEVEVFGEYVGDYAD